MYRPFRIRINEFVSSIVATRGSEFTLVKSLSRKGGLTFRQKLKSGAVFILLEHTHDRDRFSLSIAWNLRAPDLPEDAVVEVALSGERQKREARVAALVRQCQVGELPVNQLADEWLDWKIEAAEPVPWALVAMWVRSVSRARAVAILPVSEFTVESLARGDDPPFGPADPKHGLNEPYRLQHPQVSWERWFDLMHERVPTETEIDQVIGSALEQAVKQLELVLIPNARLFSTALVNASGND